MRSPAASRRTCSIAAASGTAYGVESAMPRTISYAGSPPGSSGASHIWTKTSGFEPSLRSTCRTPPAALRRCTSPGRTTVSWPAESRWVSSPSTTQVTISVWLCGCSSNPAPGASLSSLQAMTAPNRRLSGS